MKPVDWLRFASAIQVTVLKRCDSEIQVSQGEISVDINAVKQEQTKFIWRNSLQKDMHGIVN